MAKRSRARPIAHANLLRTGFRVTPRGSEVLIQTSAEVELETRPGAKFVLKRCRVVRANDRRPLDTSFFGSPVTGVRLRQRGHDLEVRVALRSATSASSRKEHGPGDSWSWILRFPAAGTTEQAAEEPGSMASTRARSTAKVAAVAAQTTHSLK